MASRAASPPARLWELLATLHPRPSRDASIGLQHFRGQPWFVVSDCASGATYRLAAGMDVVLTPESTHHSLAQRVAQRYPAADDHFREQIALASLRLYRVGLLEFSPTDRLPEGMQGSARGDAPKRRFNPLAVRLPCFDPDRLLHRLQPLARVLFGAPGLVVVALLALLFAVLGVVHADALASDLLSRIETSSAWLAFAVCYLVLKVFHEMAHALAVKRWGGHVHDIGIMLLVFFPVPYVDASASTAFDNKYHRMATAAAGIAAELSVAALALVLWLATAPGLVHTLSFNFVVIGGLSTLLFNGNPLMRFDAYYVLSDWLEIPNLYTRSRSYLKYLVLRYVLGARELSSPAHVRGEARWLAAYGAASVIYRLGVLLAIAFYLADMLFFVGVALAGWVLVSEFLRPAMRFVVELRRLDVQAPRRFGLLGRVVVATAALLAFTAFVPLPQSTVAMGVVTVADDAQVRAGAEGFLERVEARAGDHLEAGSPVLMLSNDELRRDLAAARARVLEHAAMHTAAATVDRAAARALEESLAASRDSAAEIAARMARLTVRSPGAGRYVAPDLERLAGSYVERGQNLGYIVDPAHLIVRIVVPEARMDLFQRPAQAIALRFAEDPDLRVAARTAAAVPSSLNRLPSAALGTQGHGPIPVDPADPDGLTPLVNVFQIDLRPLEPLDTVRVFGRAQARFEHPAEALLPRAVRAARRLFLTKFSS